LCCFKNLKPETKFLSGGMVNLNDIIVEFEKGKATLDNFMGLLSFLEDLFNKKIDLLTVQGVKSIRIENIRKNIEECAVYV